MTPAQLLELWLHPIACWANWWSRDVAEWMELTDGAGNFWEVSPTVGGLALDPPRDHAVEVDSATALPVLGGVRARG